MAAWSHLPLFGVLMLRCRCPEEPVGFLRLWTRLYKWASRLREVLDSRLVDLFHRLLGRIRVVLRLVLPL